MSKQVSILTEQIGKLQEILKANQEERIKCFRLLDPQGSTESQELFTLLVDHLTRMNERNEKIERHYDRLIEKMQITEEYIQDLRYELSNFITENNALKKQVEILREKNARYPKKLTPNSLPDLKEKISPTLSHNANSQKIASLQLELPLDDSLEPLSCKNCRFAIRRLQFEIELKTKVIEQQKTENEKLKGKLFALRGAKSNKESLDIATFESSFRYLKRMHIISKDEHKQSENNPKAQQIPKFLTLQGNHRDFQMKDQFVNLNGPNTDPNQEKSSPNESEGKTTNSPSKNPHYAHLNPANGTSLKTFTNALFSQQTTQPNKLKMVTLSPNLAANPAAFRKVTNISRCLRCGQMYRISNNDNMSCRFHTGGRKRMEEYDAVGMKLYVRYAWSCCNTDIGASPGCCAAEHI